MLEGPDVDGPAVFTPECTEPARWRDGPATDIVELPPTSETIACPKPKLDSEGVLGQEEVAIVAWALALGNGTPGGAEKKIVSTFHYDILGFLPCWPPTAKACPSSGHRPYISSRTLTCSCSNSRCKSTICKS